MCNKKEAAEMGHMEHLINVYATKQCPECIAEFIGYCEVPKTEANGRMTPGLWLV